MVASALKWSGGYVWACKNYDGDVQSGYGGPGFWLARPDDLPFSDPGRQDGRSRSRPWHGDPSLPPGRPEGPGNLDELDRRIFAWTRGLAHRAKLDDNAELARFATTLEKVCIDTVESGFMTKDLALLIGPDQPCCRPPPSSTRSTRTCRRPWPPEPSGCTPSAMMETSACAGLFTRRHL